MEIPVFRFNIWLDNYEEYNCSSLGDVDWQTAGTKRPVFGLFCIICAIFTIPIYGLVALAMLSLRSHSVYKIMIYLSVADILDLVFNSIFFGIMLIRGEVYCTNPRLIEVFSMGCEFFFFCSTTGCLLLAINRFGELLSIRSIFRLFQGSTTWMVLFICTIPCIFLVLFTTPLLFNSEHHFMFFDPLIFEGRFVYKNVVHLACATLLPLCSFLIYVVTLVGLLLTYGNISKRSNALNRATYRIIAQSGIIICIHLTTCLTFQAVQFVPAGAVDKMLYIAHFGWILMNGTPPFVYLTVSRKIRKKLRDILKQGCVSSISTNVVTLTLY